jgi:predicted permease
MSGLLHDIRYAFRQLLKSPGVTAIVVLTLALGIGANTALFSVVDGVLLRPLPYKNPEQLVAIHDEMPGVNARDAGMSVQERDDFQGRSGVFDQVSAVWAFDVNITGGDKPERLEGMAVNPNYFEMLGAHAALGRVFTTADYRPGFFEGAVISDALWRRMFGGDRNVLGRALRLDNDLYTIIGVMPPEFRHPGRTLRADSDIWLTAGYIALPFPKPNRQIRLFPGAIARLKPGLTLQQAQAKLDGFVTQLSQQYPTDYPAAARWSTRITPLQLDIVGSARTMLIALLTAVSMVLLIACVNIASLLLARSSVRHREMALRQALGARAGLLIRQLLTESVLLSLTGGIVAIILSFWLKSVLLQMVPASLIRVQEITLNYRVLGFALGLAVLTGFAFGLAPALQLAKPQLMDELRQGTRGSAVRLTQHRFLSTLVISEFALSLVLMVGAGLLLRSFWNLLQVQPGFQTSRLVLAHLWLPYPNNPDLNPYLKAAKRAVFSREVLRRVKDLPGVEHAVVGSGSTPFSGQRGRISFTIMGRAASPGQSPNAEIGSVTPDYLQTLGMTLVRGRSFADADDETGDRVAVIDQTAAEQYWPNEDPIGKQVQLILPGATVDPPRPTTIIGILARTKSEGLDSPYSPHIYFPTYQGVGFAMSIYARTQGKAESLQESIRSAVQSVDPNLPVFDVHTMDNIVSESLASRRFALQLMGLFAATALVLAALGIYGVMAYFVSQRVREIGIRIAVGAQRSDVLRMVASRGMALAAIGAGIGIAASLLAARLISGMLFGVSAYDPLTIVALAAILTGAALAANYFPARRAAKVDPMVALRYD